MTCKELSVVAIATGVVTIATMSIVTVVEWTNALFYEPKPPIECVDGQAYEITIEGNVKYLDEIVGTKCEVLK